MNLHITLDQAFDGLRRIVDKFGPDHTATNPGGGGSCTYAVYDEDGFLVPVCIVGQFFAALGGLRLLVDQTAALFNDYDGSPVQEQSCGVSEAVEFWDNLESRGVTADHEAKVLFAVAQKVQDGSLDSGDQTWGRALDVARKEVEKERLAGLPWN
jgi:hypothetical protein